MVSFEEEEEEEEEECREVCSIAAVKLLIEPDWSEEKWLLSSTDITLPENSDKSFFVAPTISTELELKRLPREEPALFDKNIAIISHWNFDILSPLGLKQAVPDIPLCVVGVDDDCEPIYVNCKEFIDYLLLQNGNSQFGIADEEPLSIFDAKILDLVPLFSSLYSAPDVPQLEFCGFHLDRLPEDLRPQLKWLLVGPARSGTEIHQDPDSTGAWNAVTYGKKRWVLLDPEAPATLASRSTAPAGVAWSLSEWFTIEWPTIREDAKKEKFRIFEFEQEQGEVVYVPPGWWHAVINIESSVAITHNFVHSGDLQLAIDTAANDKSEINLTAVDKVIDALKLVDDEDDKAIHKWLSELEADGIITL